MQFLITFLVYLYIYIYICIYLYIYVCVCVYIYIHVCIYIYQRNVVAETTEQAGWEHLWSEDDLQVLLDTHIFTNIKDSSQSIGKVLVDLGNTYIHSGIFISHSFTSLPVSFLFFYFKNVGIPENVNGIALFKMLIFPVNVEPAM